MTQLKIGLGNWGYSENAKSSKYGAPVHHRRELGTREHLRHRRRCPCGNNCKGRLRHQHWRRRHRHNLSTGEVIHVSKQDDQGNKCTLTACRIEKNEETPPARFRDLQYSLWVVNADFLVEYDSAEFVRKS